MSLNVENVGAVETADYLDLYISFAGF